MKQLSRILCAVDFSEPAQSAFERALALSRERSAELTAVVAVPKEQPFRRHARARIATVAALRQAAEAARVPLKISVQHGNPAGVILLHALARQPDLIVIGTHQRTGMERIRLGSVAETVTLRAACPVLIVPAPAGEPADNASTSFGSVLCAVDFSPASNPAVRHTLSLAKKGKGRVTLVHVMQGLSHTSGSRSMSEFRVPEYRTLLTQHAWRRLQDSMPAGKRSERVHLRVVTGDPATEIERIAADVNADLIVVGVTSRGAVGRRFFGSTVTRVIRTAGRPVLAVPETSRSPAGPPPRKERAFATAA